MGVARAISFLQLSGAWFSQREEAWLSRRWRKLLLGSFAKFIGHRFTVSCAAEDIPCMTPRISRKAFSPI